MEITGRRVQFRNVPLLSMIDIHKPIKMDQSVCPECVPPASRNSKSMWSHVIFQYSIPSALPISLALILSYIMIHLYIQWPEFYTNMCCHIGPTAKYFRPLTFPNLRILTGLTAWYIPSPHPLRLPNQLMSLPCFPKAAKAPPTRRWSH